MLVIPNQSPIPLTQFNSDSHSKQGNSDCAEGHLTAERWIEEAKTAEALYLHVPFCFHKCHYCDFYSIVGNESQYESFVDQFIKELTIVGSKLDEVTTIFMGGGTPTLFEEPLFAKMLNAVHTHIPRAETCEWTIEVNPETMTEEKANILVATGVNRVSIGAQSFDTTLLKSLERWHEPESVTRAVEFVTSAGIADFNLDLIHSIPGQTREQLLFDIEQATLLSPTHMSCYALTYEPNTPLRTRLERGDISRLSHDDEAAMFRLVREELVYRGYAQYEISNFAKPGHACKHNIAYWKNKNWWAIGPSASGHMNGRRWKNTPRISEYLKFDSLPSVTDVEVLNSNESAGESFMLGLRLVEGMEKVWVNELLEQSEGNWRTVVIEESIQKGYLEWFRDCLRFTEEGQCFADTVITALLMQDDENTDTTPQD